MVLPTALDKFLVLSRSFVNMLKIFFTKDVAIQYTAINTTMKKEAIKSTKFCQCMESKNFYYILRLTLYLLVRLFIYTFVYF